MSSSLRRTLVVAAIAFLAALAGVLLGRALVDGQERAPDQVHKLLHRELGLDERQLAQIEELEARFAARRKALELELKADNARLAEAIEAEHGYGPRVTAEIDRSHRAMGELQKETLSHIFAMRAVLRPEQTQKFDRVVVESLIADAE
ncbi:periplasmic heavy metal sensor [Sphingomonas parva]|uniref:Periplasmic heavy metal sensor n=1 Tax=Sphingomonas parva TaxID=2555898 RepID=A0A4Y8ZVH6_9SPHN|nr:periplasmic heavy metal sensor [Sphingomonas parva]TFI58446.1 periplasmic heavy metal sensor [Sphingomonas parva]